MTFTCSATTPCNGIPCKARILSATYVDPVRLHLLDVICVLKVTNLTPPLVPPLPTTPSSHLAQVLRPRPLAPARLPHARAPPVTHLKAVCHEHVRNYRAT